MDESIAIFAQLTVAEAVEQCLDQRQVGKDDGHNSKTLKGFPESVIGEERMTDGTEKAV